MSITDELREAINQLRVECEEKEGCGVLWYPEPTRDRFSAIADRIDIAHKHAIGYVDDRDPETMAEHGWVRLPKDADGETIHIGELVDEMLPFGGYAAPAPVDTMELSRGASGYGWLVKLDAENRASISPKLLRHHHEPTVEDVLRAFWSDVDLERADGCGDFSPIIAEYAAKLRLAGEDA